MCSITYSDGTVRTSQDIVNDLRELLKVSPESRLFDHIEAIATICSEGIKYSNQDFDVLSSADRLVRELKARTV